MEGLRQLTSLAVLHSMTDRTEWDQVLHDVVAEAATLYLVVYVQVVRRTTTLTSPSISFEHSLSQHIVFLGSEF
jgi:hypothetical protein